LIERRNNPTRRRILKVALKHFAEYGYPGASIQRIVTDAKITKPTLYYYFRSKAGLYQALLDFAYDERHQIMLKAVAGKTTLFSQLVAIMTALFEFLQWNRALMRIAFATAFASPGELPPKLDYLEKASRNYEFIHSLIKQALATGELSAAFASEDLTMGFFGIMNVYVMAYLVNSKMKLDAHTAERIVQLFLDGAGRQSGSWANKMPTV